MADFGVGEAIAATSAEAGAKGAETAGAAAGADLLAPAADIGAGLTADETALALGGGAVEGLGAPSAALTVNALPGIAGATSGGLGIGDLLGGAGAALGGVGSAIGSGLSSIGDALIPSAGAAPAPTGPTAGPGVSSNAADPFQSLGQGGFPTAQGAGQGAAAFAPAPGVQIPGGLAPDATSAAAFNDPSFADRALPAVQAGQNGTFAGFETPDSPVGAGAGAADFSAAPPGSTGTTFPAAGTPTASPNLGDFATQPGSGTSASLNSGQLGAGGGQPLDVTTNPVPAPTQPSPLDITPKTPGTDTSILGKVGQGAIDSVTKNPLGLGLGALGLGLNLKNANAQSQAIKNVQAQAAQQSQTANQLANYALTGTVPAGSQAAIDQSIAEAKANAVSNAAGQGLPTDPTKNTALAATLAKIDAQGPILAQQIANQLLQSGGTYAGLSDQLYTQLAQIDQSQRASMGKAIANFASALNTGGTKIQIGGTSA